MDWRYSSNIILVQYPGYSGGKFFINSLGFHQSCHPSVRHGDNKIDAIFATLPPTKEECLNWVRYELSCGDFWGSGVGYIQQRPVTPRAIEILKNHYCFLVVHRYSLLLELKEYFPNSKTIQLCNSKRFQDIAIKLKAPELDLHYEDPPEYYGDFIVDVDGSYFSWDMYIAELTRCWQWMNLEPIYDPRLNDYYTRYMELHIPSN